MRCLFQSIAGSLIYQLDMFKPPTSKMDCVLGRASQGKADPLFSRVDLYGSIHPLEIPALPQSLIISNEHVNWHSLLHRPLLSQY